MKPSGYPSDKMKRLLTLAGLIVLAGIMRYRFLAGAAISEFDPWRHLALIDNIRTGAGFTLFHGQPYIWYNGIWYHLAAMFGPASSSAYLSATLSISATVVFFQFLLRSEHSLPTALTGGLLVAAYGPLITFTSGYGSESFALLLVLLSCLLATCQQSRLAVIAAGILFGIALVSRINFVFSVFLLLPLLKGRMNRTLFPVVTGAVVIAGWWHNQGVIAAHPYLFTWDGMATGSTDYNVIATLVPQLHPDVASATRTLYEQVAGQPFDLFSRGYAAWGNVLFIVLGTSCVLATGRWWLILATLAPLIYFNFLDTTLSTNFYRHYLALFPQLFVGIAVVCGRFTLSTGHWPGVVRLTWLPPLLVILSGAAYLHPQPMPTLEMVTPPPEVLTRDHYMVNSGFYHPESLIRRYPGKAFIGMPLHPEQFEEFSRHYPQYATIIWHTRFSVQEPLFRYLTESGRYRIVANATNEAGLGYLILEKERGNGQHHRSR